MEINKLGWSKGQTASYSPSSKNIMDGYYFTYSDGNFVATLCCSELIIVALICFIMANFLLKCEHY